MGSATYKGQKYALSFVDGYVVRPERRRIRKIEQRLPEGTPFERVFSEVVYQRSGGFHYEREDQSPSPLQVWVAGNDDWLNNPPEILRPLIEGETNDSYRLIILGGDIEVLGTWLVHSTWRWSSSLYDYGMRKVRKHGSRTVMKEKCSALGQKMLEDYHQFSDPPTSALEKHNIPFAHRP